MDMASASTVLTMVAALFRAGSGGGSYAPSKEHPFKQYSVQLRGFVKFVVSLNRSSE